ncbi:MAG: class I SAM-dependent methyltransferase, partial [Myxococcota bacterium]
METYFGLHALEGEWHSLLPRYLMVSELLRGKRVLEVGCSHGVGTALLEHLGIDNVVAIDHRPERIQAAQNQFEALASHFQDMFYEELAFESDSFDAVICLSDTFPISDEAVLAEVTRVLRPEGLFVAAWASVGAYGLELVLGSLDPFGSVV